MNEIEFNFDAPLTKPVDEAAPEITAPPQTADAEEYLCGNAGPGFPGNNPGRDQDRSRADERQAAVGCARYVS